MTLQKLKAHTNSLLIGDVKLPSNDLYIPLLSQALMEIANEVDCLSLITKSSDARVLRVIEDGYYIRMPKTPRLDNEKIDMDEELMYSLSNLIASYISNIKPMFYATQAQNIISSYSFKLYNTDSDCA